MSLIDGSANESERDSSFSSRTPLINSFNRILRKKHSAVIIGFCIFITAFVCSFTISFFIIRSKSARAFKSGLIKHIEKEHSNLDSSKRVSIVNDLIKIHKSGKISNDAATELDIYVDFESFNIKYDRTDISFDKKTDRFVIFRENYLIVKNQSEKVPYTIEINKFADMSEEEFNKLHPEIKPPTYFTPSSKHIKHLKRSLINSTYLSKLKLAKKFDHDINDISDINGEELDWRKADVLTPVKDQGRVCGSCWAFSSIASVEGIYKLYRDKVYNLSEQELVNCDIYSKGCNGGLPYTALEYIHSNGVSLNKDLPYDGIDEQCIINSFEKIYIDSLTVTKGADILNKSLVLSPTVVAIAVDSEMKLYKSGVYTGKCAKELNHAVLLVGESYDPESKKRYWIIKNSWGTDWGEDGYLRLERTKDGLDKCGILTFGLNPILY